MFFIKENMLNMKSSEYMKQTKQQYTTHSCSSLGVCRHTHRCSRRGWVSENLQHLLSKLSNSKDLKGGKEIISSVSHVWNKICEHQQVVSPKPLTVNNFQLLGHTTLGCPHTVGGLTAVHPSICFGHTLKLLLQTNKRKVRGDVKVATACV